MGAIDRVLSLNLAAIVLIVVLYGASILVGLRNMNSDMMDDALFTAQRWYDSGLGDRAKVERLLAGGSLTPMEWQHMRIADDVGNLNGFEIYSPHGHLARASAGRVMDGPAARAEKEALAHRAIATGEIQTRLVHEPAPPPGALAGGHPSALANPVPSGKGDEVVFAEIYKPVPLGDGRIAVVMARLDLSMIHNLGHAKLDRLIFLATILAGLALAYTVATAVLLRRQRGFDQRIDRLAHYDVLTGIANRTLFNRRAPQLLALQASEGREVAVYMADLDRFKAVNDSIGQADADVLLTVIANRLVASAPGLLVARHGGDEFAILHPNLASAGAAARQARTVVDVVRSIEVGGAANVNVSISVGYTVAPATTPLSDLLRQAGAALYAAKHAGRDQAVRFEAGMDEITQARARTRFLLREALRKEHFELFFQPLHEAGEGALTSFEALLRLPDGKGGYISPEVFIPLAEEMALIADIGAWVLVTACTVATEWPAPISVSVNISPLEFESGDILARVDHALAVSGLSPDRLEVEITETLFIANAEAVSAKLHQLRARGVRVVMDDFGTGYSSLQNLWRFPFDKLKVDRSCFMSLGESESVPVILRTIRAMTEAMKLRITAEGIETETQRAFAQSAGYDEMQGYLYSRPIPVSALAAYIRATTRRGDAPTMPDGRPAAAYGNVTELRPAVGGGRATGLARLSQP